MLRSLFAGISGLRVHQEMLDVTGNNIANVNTTGFKSSQAVFEDTLSQTLSAAGAGTTTTGGTNPAQVGLGVKVAGINTNFTQGSAETTGRNTDLMIQGDGFFVVNEGGQQLYTRAGALSLDAQGRLTTPDGGLVQGWNANNGVVTASGATSPVTITPGTYQSFSIGSNGTVVGLLPNGTEQPIAQLALATFANPAGLEKTGDTMYGVTANSGAAQIGASGTNGTGTVVSGALEMSNVDLSQEFTNLIIAQRGFQANSKVITTSDQLLQTLMDLKQ